MLFRSKNRLLSLPVKMAMQVSGEKDLNRIIQVLNDGMLEALKELSEYDPDEIDQTELAMTDIEDLDEDEEL